MARCPLMATVELLGKFAKQRPRVIEKKLKRAAMETERKSIKAQVFRRDSGRYRVCGAPATDLHELRFRSLGGKRSLHNSITVCDWRHTNCHALLQTLVIAYAFASESFGADST